MADNRHNPLLTAMYWTLHTKPEKKALRQIKNKNNINDK